MGKKISHIASKSKYSLYVQGYNYSREAAALGPTDTISCEYQKSNGETSHRYGVASTYLYHLTEDGQLDPLAIVIDWKGSANNSITVFNRELNMSDQAMDWVWRYAKTCVQTSDWLRHDVTVHLTNTHIIEEATIVAAK